MTEVSLKEFLEQKICALGKRIDDRFIALDKALELQAGDRKDRLAIWVALCSLIIALLTLIAVVWGAK